MGGETVELEIAEDQLEFRLRVGSADLVDVEEALAPLRRLGRARALRQGGDDLRAQVERVHEPALALARMDRALLRCGLCEVLHSPATPARVAIAEWVELARTYSGEPMRRLMNGVLGRVARDLDATR